MKEEIINIAFALQHIAMTLDNENLEKIKPYLKTIEINVKKMSERNIKDKYASKEVNW